LHASADEILGLDAENGSVKQKTKGAVAKRRLLRRIQQIDSLPKREQEARLRTIDAFLSMSDGS